MINGLGTSIINSLVFAFLGIGCFVVGFFIIDRLTPYALWKEIIEKQNKALAIVIGAVSLGICFIVGMAIN